MDKTRLRQAIIERIHAELEMQTRAALMARDEATHEESKPENQYDMHAQEAAYLAEGQAKLAAELQASIALYQNLALPDFTSTQPVGLGAVVTLDAAGRKTRYFIGPRNGGIEIVFDGAAIMVITPQSPLGRLLIGRRVGDSVNIPGRTNISPQRIDAIE
jgi:transcription elongation GreA/GreB family factor